MIQTYASKNDTLKTSYKKIGIYVAKSGKSIKSKNKEDYVFTPDKPSFSIKERFQMQVSTVAGVDTGGILWTAVRKHNFGYIPQVIAFTTTEITRQGAGAFNPGLTYVNVPSQWQSADDILGGQCFENFDCYADENNVYIGALRYTLVPMVGVTFLGGNYTFDILLAMEEAK